MRLPYNRPHLMEFHDQPWCPNFIRAHCQAILTFIWTHRIPPFQLAAPYEGASMVLEGLVREVEDEDGEYGRAKKKGKLRVVDCCSGAGGPLPMIERRVNQQRKQDGRPALPILLSDLHPHLPSWSYHACRSPSSALSFLPYPVDATRVPPEIHKDRHVRTFYLSFHHFGETGARKVLEDAMRTAEAICICELQEPDIGSIITIMAVFPLVYLFTPFLRPSLLVLLLVYIIPIIPFIMLFDGLVSAYRTRSLDHIKHLANLASVAVSLEGGDREGYEWRWREGRRVHTRPFGKLYWVIGKRERVGHVEGETTDGGTESGD